MQSLNSTEHTLYIPVEGPFSLSDEKAYQAWREKKLSAYPVTLENLIVQIENPFSLTVNEKRALLDRCQTFNMAIYQFLHPCGDPDDKIQVRKLGEQMGLVNLDSNLCADNDSITSLKVVPNGRHKIYIPYSSHKISWHTDGYYNALDHQIRGMILHCVSPAEKGGENALVDPEMVYIHLRDRNPAYINALMQPDAMTIPPNEEQGKVIRAEQSGPVFSVEPESGHLHMRYTARTRSIVWKQDQLTGQAVKALCEFFSTDSQFVFHHKLESGQGLISNNVLHNRSAFEDSQDISRQRLLYRARYFDRVINN
ncbi:MAG: TauD/TfdA family dioxygenase [Gammaproteobacteria bacterium]|nr:TauD/TfdA family dioxygenase [Gammaproteobacteria bacterium]